MIATFRSKGLRAFAERGDTSKLSVQNPDRIRRILLALDSATAPDQINLPGFRFHGLRGRDKGRYSVWVSGNFRISFDGMARTLSTSILRIITDGET